MVRFEDFTLKELREIATKYSDRTQIPNFKTLKKKDLVIVLSNDFELFKGKLYLKRDASNAKNLHNQKVDEEVIQKLKRLNSEISSLIRDLSITPK